MVMWMQWNVNETRPGLGFAELPQTPPSFLACGLGGGQRRGSYGFGLWECPSPAGVCPRLALLTEEAAQPLSSTQQHQNSPGKAPPPNAALARAPQ